MGKRKQRRGARRGSASESKPTSDARPAANRRPVDPLLLGPAASPNDGLRPTERGLPFLCAVFRALRQQNEAQHGAVSRLLDNLPPNGSGDAGAVS